MSFPLLFAVGLHVYSDGAKDDYGNYLATYTPALTADGTSYRVYGWSVPRSVEPKLAGHDRVTVDLELLAPDTFPATAHDVVDVDGDQYEVIGVPEDYNHGPFGWAPGIVVNLKRSTG